MSNGYKMQVKIESIQLRGSETEAPQQWLIITHVGGLFIHMLVLYMATGLVDLLAE